MTIMRHKPFRMQPSGPPVAYRTFAYRRPLATHWRPATCAEVDCPPYLHGWMTTVDERGDKGMAQAYYIRREAGRGYREHRDERGLTIFVFAPGQRCFGSDKHRLPIEREPLWIVRDGDWRGNPTGWKRIHPRGSLWVEEWGEHQDRLRARQQRG